MLLINARPHYRDAPEVMSDVASLGSAGVPSRGAWRSGAAVLRSSCSSQARESRSSLLMEPDCCPEKRGDMKKNALAQLHCRTRESRTSSFCLVDDESVFFVFLL